MICGLKSSHGPVAQLGERTVRIRKVVGSNPFRSTILRKITAKSAVIFRLTKIIAPTFMGDSKTAAKASRVSTLPTSIGRCILRKSTLSFFYLGIVLTAQIAHTKRVRIVSAVKVP